MQHKEIKAVSALHKLKRRGLPYKYDLNIYRGCSHGCKYCYAQKSHKYLGAKDFTEEIFVKTNIAEALEETLSSPGWQGDVINIGGVCDSYQPAEKRYKLMPEILQVLIKYKNPVILSTKSDLVMRDLELIDELAYYTYVNIPVCITSTSPELSRQVEPGASLPQERLKALQALGKTRANTGLHIFPILPFLADDFVTIEELVQWANQAQVNYLMTGVLYLTGGIKSRYLSFIRNMYPEYYQPYLQLYPKGSASKEYKSKIHGFLQQMRKKYGVQPLNRNTGWPTNQSSSVTKKAGTSISAPNQNTTKTKKKKSVQKQVTPNQMISLFDQLGDGEKNK